MSQILTENALRAAKRPVRKARFGPSEIVIERPHAGEEVYYIRSAHPLGDYPPNLTAKLDYWATEAPGRIFFAERNADGEWRSLTYAQALIKVRTIGQALLEANLSSDRPLVILS